jgi:hypothetical protein
VCRLPLSLPWPGLDQKSRVPARRYVDGKTYTIADAADKVTTAAVKFYVDYVFFLHQIDYGLVSKGEICKYMRSGMLFKMVMYVVQWHIPVAVIEQFVCVKKS